jgi:hypothetical protein
MTTLTSALAAQMTEEQLQIAILAIRESICSLEKRLENLRWDESMKQNEKRKLAHIRRIRGGGTDECSLAG